MARIRSAILCAAALTIVIPGRASGAPPHLAIHDVVVSGGTGAVTGVAEFDSLTGAVSVVGPEAVHTKGELTQTDAGYAAGVQLVDATITELPGGLRFTWHLTNLPEQTPPEVVLYGWDFQIGDRAYQLSAKRSDMLSINAFDEPVRFAERLASQQAFFRLRGNCGVWREVVTGCSHMGWLEGTFDSANKQVRIDLPFQARDELGRIMIPELKPGAVLQEFGNIRSGFQYAPVAVDPIHSSVRDTITGTSPYYVGPQVILGVASRNTDPLAVDYSSTATLTGTSFSGMVKGLSKSASKDTVFARACSAVTCSYTTFTAPL